MKSFELTFLVDPETLTDDVIDALYDQYDCLAGGRPHSSTAFVTLTITGVDAMQAVRSGWGALCAQGLRVLDVDRDLVDVAEIAARTGTSRQAVHHWIKGTRRDGFPQPFTDAGRGLWLWAEVHSWAQRNSIAVEDPDMAYPSRDDHDEASLLVRNGWDDGRHRGRRRVRNLRRTGRDAGTEFYERLLDEQSHGSFAFHFAVESQFRHEYTTMVDQLLRERSNRPGRRQHA